MVKKNKNNKNSVKNEAVKNEVAAPAVEELADIEAAVVEDAPAAEETKIEENVSAVAEADATTDNIWILTDENGEELEFEIIADYEKDGNKYFAMFPPEDIGDEDSDIIEYVILKLAYDEEGNECLVSVDDPDELDDIADYFDDRFSAEIDYDVN